MSHTERLVTHCDIATSLALRSDRELVELVEAGTPSAPESAGVRR